MILIFFQVRLLTAPACDINDILGKVYIYTDISLVYLLSLLEYSCNSHSSFYCANIYFLRLEAQAELQQ